MCLISFVAQTFSLCSIACNLKVCATDSVNQRQIRLWHLLVRQVSKSHNPENLIILKILVQTTVRGQSTKSTPNTPMAFIGATSVQKP